ncbi:MAG: trehalose-phosphatase [bacterium]
MTPPPPSADWAYFLDVDGTLVALAPTPDAARLTDAAHAAVRALRARAGGALALVSGRSLADLDAFFGAPLLAAAGQHGLEQRGADGRLMRFALPPGGMETARARLAAVVSRTPGLLLEDKGMSLALHYRAAPRLGGYAHRMMRGLARELGPPYSVQVGKRMVELRPASLHKGDAIAAFMAGAPFRGRVPVFIGDDATDEHGFAVVNGLGGHSIKVGPGRTQAEWWLPDVDAVCAWLSS